MQVVVLAGGIGSRLRPWTNDVPKPLLPMLDATLLERVVEGVPSDLVDEVIVAGGYKVELIREYFAKADVDFDVRIVPEDQPLGTGGALGNCRDIVSGRFACFNGDIVSSLDVGPMLEQHSKMNVKGTLALWEVEDPTRFGIVGLDDDNKVTQFKEKPKPEEVFSKLINAGSYLLEDDVFDIMPQGKHSLERDVFPVLAEEGSLAGFPFEGYFIDAGTPSSWHDGVLRCIEEKRFNVGSISQGSWHEGKRTIARNSMVQAGCVVAGEVSDSTLLRGARIESGAVVKNCLIGEDAVIGMNAKLSGVVVGHRSVVPPGHIQSEGTF
ncbi:MAG: sugar phosphate nucleotidyltransferase [Candidatus Poseidoniaceae archaeon]